LIALFVFSILYKFISNPTCHSGLSRIGFWSRCAPQNDVVSALIVSFPIFLIYFISKERAMGLGDVYLSGIMGFLLGWQAGFLALYIAFVTGAIFGLVAIIFKNKKLKSKVAFGPFLVLGIISVLFYQKELFEIVRKILGY
jgi:prepilin signal peptidase PulO-like enzyme (type II secretory pathway)